ncbi:hypothetical protein SSS_07915 [Sarcoptes scabiei]|uniref:Protein LSM14 -like protein B-B n=1 Tax=Sarcoptes scabiei TaxID=52283 RepID=A0A834R7R5_SARSC|nr:hypothetical protein SSS_07915 [Sarcoptes scabiei]UXI18850.1 Myelin regulatory factor [Sarcoptes scabiei]
MNSSKMAKPMISTPFYGSKMTLISKLGNRYEGLLCHIDPNESTLTLSQVRSFGSEDRNVENKFAPMDKIFDYIKFNAADIKDLVVDQPPAPPLTEDPAIVQAHSTSSNSHASFSQLSSNNAGHSSSSLQQGSFQNNSSISGLMKHNQSQPSTSASSSNVQESVKPKPSTSIAQIVATGTNNSQPAPKNQPNKVLPQRNNANQSNRQFGGNNQQNNRNQRLETGGNSMGNRNLNRRPNTGNRSMNGPIRSGGSHFSRSFEMRFQQRQPTGFNNFNNRLQNNRNYVTRPPMKSSITIPDSEFDFEKAQDEFKQLEEKLANLKVNGDAPETTTDSSEEKTENEIPKENCYNKKKSFFDKISCEALEREKGNVKRLDWKAEQKLNSETFGIGAPIRRNGFKRFTGSMGGGGGNRFRKFNFPNRGVQRNPNNAGNGSNNRPNKPTSNGLSNSFNAGQSTSAGVAPSSSNIVSPAKN